MSLWAQDGYAIPDATARTARAAFPKGCMALRIRDQLGELFRDGDFADVFPVRGRPGLSPARLMLVSILQFAEGLTDRQAADAVRGRLDWKYALGLDLDDSGFDASVLTEFRQRLLIEDEPARLLQLMLDRLRDRGLLRRGGRQRTDATSVVMAVREVNRLEQVAETMRAALEAIAAAAPDWLAAHWQPDWPIRYGQRATDYRLPNGKQARDEYAAVVGRDGFALMQAVYAETDRSWLAELHQVEVLRATWIQQYYRIGDTVIFRDSDSGLPPGARFILSPYDVDARHGFKHHAKWLGYKAHFTEACEPDLPHLLVHVGTSHAATSDIEVMADLHADLAAADLIPDEHLVDAGYVSVDGVLYARDQYGISIVGPLPPDSAWQARDPDAFDISRFRIDFDNRTVTCPNGKVAINWWEGLNRNQLPIVHVGFGRRNCTPCNDRASCTRSRDNPRSLTFRPQRQFAEQQRIRAEQATPEWRRQYAHRSGAESTMAQASARADVHRTRYRGLAKTHLQNVLIAIALNLIRLDAWLSGAPIGKAWTSRLTKISTALAA